MHKRNMGLDIARASAVLMVLASHWLGGLWWTAAQVTPGAVSMVGASAVHLFFALSGFLIGGLLFDLAEAPTLVAWSRFMLRRWGRTLPLYAAVLAALAALSPSFAHVAGQFASMSMNVAWPLPDGGELLGTAWSLCVEEWFYLLFSIAFLGAVFLWGQRAAWPVILGFVVVPFALRGLLSWQDAYHTVLPSLDGIAYGVALARLHREGSTLFRHPWKALAAGVALLAVAWTPYAFDLADLTARWQPGTLMMSCVGWCLVLVAALHVTGELGWFGRMVRTVAAGSYPVYLVHLPVLLFLNHLMVTGISLPVEHGIPVVGTLHLRDQTAIFLASTILLAWVGHRWIELPGMRLRPRQHPCPALTGASA